MAKSKHKQRLGVVDAVRALALFGVLVMNLREMSGLGYLSDDAWAALQGPMGASVDLLLRILLDEKSLSGFSFLFGLSFALLMASRADQPGFLGMYLRRLAVLAAFGAFNIAFLFWGDILLTYSVLGFLLLAAIHLPQRALLALAAGLVFGTPALLAALGAAHPPHMQTFEDLHALAGFGSPLYGDAVAEGFHRYFGVANADGAIAYWDTANIFGLFLLGLWTGRARIPHAIDAHRRLLVRTAGIGVGLGLPAATAWALLPQNSPLATLLLFSAPLLALGYLAGAALLLDSRRGAWLCERLAPAGRLALTNYLTYGLIGQILFYGWALDLIGQVDSASLLLLSVVIYAALLALSRRWLDHFRIGPAEWLWRSLTYLRAQPLRRRPPAAPLLHRHGK